MRFSISEVTDILSRTVSELPQLIVQISLQLGHFDSKFQVEGVATPTNHFCTNSKANECLTNCYGWGATSENRPRSKIGDFAPTRSLWSKISGTRGRPPPIMFARLVRPMNALQLTLPLTVFTQTKLCSRLSSSEVRFHTKIDRFAFLRPPLGDLGSTYDDHWKARSWLPISVNWTFFVRCYDWGATGEYRLRIGDFALTGVGWPKISRKGSPHQPFFFSEKYSKWSFVWCINLDRSSTVLSQCTRVTDRQTNRYGQNSHR